MPPFVRPVFQLHKEEAEEGEEMNWMVPLENG